MGQQDIIDAKDAIDLIIKRCPKIIKLLEAGDSIYTRGGRLKKSELIRIFGYFPEALFKNIRKILE